MERRRADRFFTVVVTTIAAVMQFWLALRSDGSDWYISQTHADIFYTAVARFHQFPFFSFVFNGGTYFLQDPQNNLFSPTALFILAAGPSIGLRLIAPFWCALGAYAFIVWMRRRVDATAAQLAALAWVLSLGVSWRIAVGNDMFLWHLGLPLFLIAIEDVLQQRTIASAVRLGVLFGLYLWGPTFHSLMYMLVPTLLAFLVVELLVSRLDRAAIPRIIGLLTGAVVLGLVIAAAKLICWTRFAMHRPTSSDGVLSLADALRCLVDYSHVRWSKLMLVSHHAITETYWGIEEGAVALPPLATLAAVVGLVAVARRARGRRTAAFALVCLAISLCVVCSSRLWDLFRTLTNGSFRVAPRFLGIGGVGMAILAAIGFDAAVVRFARWRVPIFAGCSFVLVVSSIWWTTAAGNVVDRAPNDVVQASAIDVWSRAQQERAQAAAISTFRGLVPLQRGQRRILEGFGLSDGFFVVGNQFYPGRWPGHYPLPIVDGLPPADATVEHTRIELRHLPPRVHLRLRIIDPLFGLSIRTVPASARVDARGTNEGFLIDNRSDALVERLIITPRLPISAAWFGLSALALLASIGFLWTQRRRAAAASA